MCSLYKNECRIFKLVETTIRKVKKKKKNRGDERIWVVIHIYMEVPQGNSLCSYLKQNCHFFLNFAISIFGKNKYFRGISTQSINL
jgi:hypothetical protein